MNDKTLFVLASAVTAVGVVLYTKIHRTESAKREQIKKDSLLDVAAIKLAGERIRSKVENGEYDGRLSAAMFDLNTEIAFQKITIRER